MGGRPPAGPPNIKEKYFDWRDDLLTEQGLIFEVDDKTDNKKRRKKLLMYYHQINQIKLNSTQI